MAAKFDNVSSEGNGNNGNTLSWSHTLGSVGGSGLVIVVAEGSGSGAASNNPVSSITFNGVAMTKVNSGQFTGAGQNTAVSMYELHGSSLPSAGTYTIVVTYVGSISSRAAGAMSFKNVKPQVKEATAVLAGNGTTTFSTSITTLTKNALVVVGYGNQNNVGNPSYSTGETAAFNKGAGSPEDSLVSGAYKTVATPASTLTSFSVNNPETEVLILASFETIAPGGIIGYDI